jgi:hypothetical protein
LDVNVEDDSDEPAWYIFAKNGDFGPFEQLLARPHFDPSLSALLPQWLDNLGNCFTNYDYATEEGVGVLNAARILRRLDEDQRFQFPVFKVLDALWPIFYFAFSEDCPVRDTDGYRHYEVNMHNIWDSSGSLRVNLGVVLKSHRFAPCMRDSCARTFLHCLAGDTYTQRRDIEDFVRFITFCPTWRRSECYRHFWFVSSSLCCTRRV